MTINDTATVSAGDEIHVGDGGTGTLNINSGTTITSVNGDVGSASMAAWLRSIRPAARHFLKQVVMGIG